MQLLNGKISRVAIAIILCGLFLSFIGILTIHSAMSNSPSRYEHDYYKRQIVWLLVSLVAFAVVVLMPMRFFEVFAYVFYAIVVVLLVGLLFVGSGKAGRWYSVGFFNLQVSELAKIVVVFVLARYLSYSRRAPNSVLKLAVVLCLVLIPMLLILRQPDLGTSLVFLAILIMILYWSGLPATYMLLLISPAVSLVASSHWISWVVFFVLLLVLLQVIKPGTLFSSLVIATNLISGAIMPFVWNKLEDYQKLRILAFLDPSRDPLGAGYQIIQSKVAIGSGGLWGKGYMAGTQTGLAFIPERHTDFVFSVLGEELGFWGAGLTLLACLAIVLIGVRVAYKCRNRFASFVAIGGITILAFQIVVNVGMTLGMMPVTGLPLPFLSYGGSSMLLCWIILGLLFNAEMHWQEY